MIFTKNIPVIKYKLTIKLELDKMTERKVVVYVGTYKGISESLKMELTYERYEISKFRIRRYSETSIPQDMDDVAP